MDGRRTALVIKGFAVWGLPDPTVPAIVYRLPVPPIRRAILSSFRRDAWRVLSLFPASCFLYAPHLFHEDFQNAAAADHCGAAAWSGAARYLAPYHSWVPRRPKLRGFFHGY